MARPAGVIVRIGTMLKICRSRVRGTVLSALGLTLAGRVGSRMHRRACGSFGYQDFLAVLEDDNPAEQIIVITDNLSSRTHCPHATG